jgi:hypothetical protein
MALSLLWSPDKLIWIGTSNGCFSVKSAYHQEMARRVEDKGESSNHKEVTEVWNQIWKLPVQGVVKNFIWKFCSNALPTKVALHRRHIVSDPVCPVCLQCSKSHWHMVWECPASVAVWQECSRPIQKLSLLEDDGLG